MVYFRRSGETGTVFSGKSGYFRFNDAAANETYIFSVAVKLDAYRRRLRRVE